MTANHTLLWPNPRLRTVLHSLLLLMVVLSLLPTYNLLQPVPGSIPVQSRSQTAASTQPASVATTTTAPATRDLRGLPADVLALPERTELRTARSATFQHPDGRYTSILSSRDLHYQDPLGRWQVIDPTFRATERGYVVAANSIQSRTGSHLATVTATAGDASFSWQAIALGRIEGSAFIPLAAALTEPATTPRKEADGRMLRYANTWDDSTLTDTFASRPGSIEHSLVLAQPPRVPATSDYLELHARLRLAEGTTLWAADRQQTAAFRSRTGFELRDAAGKPMIAFQPVFAYEQNHPDVMTTGEYSVYPDTEANTWIVGVRTPMTWWTATDRQYPAVLDPTMTVLTSTGYGAGMAWVSPPGAPGNGISPDPGHYQFNQAVLGASGGEAMSRSYIQFNHMPAMLTNSPIQVQSASLELTPNYGFYPHYEYDSDEGPDWDEKTISRDVRLWPLNLADTCLDPFSSPNCFSLIDNRLSNPSFNWDNRPPEVGSPVIKPLTVGPGVKGGKGQTQSWDVTASVQAWYDISHPRPAHGPIFILSRNDETCYLPMYLMTNGTITDPDIVRNCLHLRVFAENAHLKVTYDSISLTGAQSNLINLPGVPSYAETGDGKEIFADSNHIYNLPTGSGHWVGVAVRGDHFLHGQSPVPVYAGLKVLDPANTILGGGREGANTTSYALIDAANNGSAANQTLKAMVVRNELNNFPADQQRNYRIHTAAGSNWTPQVPAGGTPGVPDGTWRTETTFFDSDELVKIREFELGAKYTGGVIVTATAALDLAIVEPTSGSLVNAVRSYSKGASGILNDFAAGPNDTRTLTFGGLSSNGKYALVLVNKERPFLDEQRAGRYEVKVSILACPEGTIPTARFGCQALVRPHQALAGQYNYVTPQRSVGNLIVYSEGNFNGPPNGAWCTIPVSRGAALIGPTGGAPFSPDRYIYVAQGSICWDPATQTIYTTDDSGTGIGYPKSSPNVDGTTRLKFAPSVGIYGDPMLYPAPSQYGRLTCRVLLNLCAGLYPETGTMRRVQPFKEWKTSFTPTAGSDYIRTTSQNGGQAVGAGTINVPVVVDKKYPAQNIQWDVSWTLYPSPNAPVPNGNPTSDFLRYLFTVNVTQTPALAQPALLASVELRVLDGPNGPASGKILIPDNLQKSSGPTNAQFSAPDAKLTLPPQLGGGQTAGATKRIKVAVLPPGEPRRSPVDDPDPSTAYCGDANTSCLEIRRPNFQWDNGNGDVKLVDLPDVFIQDQAGMISFSHDGQLTVFSNDHPNAAPNDFDQSFAFETWGASVKVTEETCGGPDLVTVIRGRAAIALPMLGDDGSNGGPVAPPAVVMDFKLCETELNYAKLELDIAPTYVPVGATGLGVDLLGGEVTIAQDHTEISLTVGFRSVPSDATLSDGFGTVTIDTRGMFQVDAGATIVGVLNADLELRVAWAPLDVLFKAGVSAFGGLISGELKMHAWIGQGWQNQYSWLPNNKDFHFTGSIKAQLFIEEDMVVAYVPPFDITRGVSIAFGEFCQNDNCTDYSWGMSASTDLVGFTVGLYVDDEGPELFLGSDDHTLIDEFGGGNGANGPESALDGSPNTPNVIPPIDVTGIELPGNWQPLLYPMIQSPVASWQKKTPAQHGCVSGPSTTLTCTFNILANKAGRAVFSVAWQNGTLDVALIKPDSTVVTTSEPGIVVTQTLGLDKRVTFAVTPVDPMPAVAAGQWKLRISGSYVNGPPNGPHHGFSMLFASDPPKPTLTWLTPVSQVNGTTEIDLEWFASRAGQPVDEYMELFYTPVQYKPITDTEVISATIIANKIHAFDGSLTWDTTGLATGEYAIGARIDDHRQGNGHLVFWAPGSVLINDTTPPPAPAIQGSETLADALVVTWKADVLTKDLAGYLIEYTYPSWDNQDLNRVKRVLPRARATSFWHYVPGFQPTEQARLGGLLAGYVTTVCLRAFDASGNVSSCAPTAIPIDWEVPNPLSAPQNLAAQTSRSPLGLQVTWNAPASGSPAGYLLAYEPTGCQVPGGNSPAAQGFSPLNVGLVTNYLLTGLKEGQRYLVTVAGVKSSGVIGDEASTIGMYANPADMNGDGLPDGWQSIFQVTGSTQDPDQDGLSNIEEFNQGTYPTKSDSDHDGYYDKTEITGGSDPCAPNSMPVGSPDVMLALGGSSQLNFAVTSNLGSAEAKALTIFNQGSSALSWSATASHPWIVLSANSGVEGEQLHVTVNKTGLAPGIYQGAVTIQNTTAMAGNGPLAAAEKVSIPVSFVVRPPRWFSLAEVVHLANLWGQTNVEWDLTGDGIVTIQDIQIACANWLP